MLCGGECERVLVMYCGNAQHIVALELTLCYSCAGKPLEVVIHALKLLHDG